MRFCKASDCSLLEVKKEASLPLGMPSVLLVDNVSGHSNYDALMKIESPTVFILGASMCTAKLKRCHMRVPGSISRFAGQLFQKWWVKNCSKNEMEACFWKKAMLSDIENYDVALGMRK